MTKVDFRKKLNLLYAPAAKAVVEVDVPPLNFLMIDGAGDPNRSQAYTDIRKADPSRWKTIIRQPMN